MHGGARPCTPDAPRVRVRCASGWLLDAYVKSPWSEFAPTKFHTSLRHANERLHAAAVSRLLKRARGGPASSKPCVWFQRAARSAVSPMAYACRLGRSSMTPAARAARGVSTHSPRQPVATVGAGGRACWLRDSLLMGDS